MRTLQLVNALCSGNSTVLNRAHAPTRRMLVDQKGLGKPPALSGKKETSPCGPRMSRTMCEVCFRTCVALSFAMASQDVFTAAVVALGVPELDDDTSAGTHGHLFSVPSALTDGESFDVVTSAGDDRDFESWASCTRWESHTERRARSLLREMLSPLRAKLPVLMGAIKRKEDLVRRYCGRRDTLADDMRRSSLKALLLEDLEKHVRSIVRN